MLCRVHRNILADRVVVCNAVPIRNRELTLSWQSRKYHACLRLYVGLFLRKFKRAGSRVREHLIMDLNMAE